MILSGGVQMSVNESRRSYDRAFKVEAVRLSREPIDAPAMIATYHRNEIMPL